MQREVIAVLRSQAVIDDGDMMLWRALPAPKRLSIGPFVFLDHYRHRSRRGIGDKPHPHAGIEVVSYLLDGAMEHRDSLGFTDRIGAGDAQLIRAGRGILHAEMPEGGRHGLQLWTSLPPAMKLAEPTYTRVTADRIPERKDGGAVVKVIVGDVDGMKGPLALASRAVLTHVRLTRGASASLRVPDDVELGICLLQGRAQIADAAPTAAGYLSVLSAGRHLKLVNVGEEMVDAVLLGGTPAEGPILFGGSFVMDTQERLQQARRDFLSGAMGRLDGVPF